MTEPIRERVSLNNQTHRFDPEQISSVIEPVPIDSQPNVTSPVGRSTSENSESSRSSQSGPNMGRSLGQILIVMVVLLVLVNIPFNSYSAGLAQLMPQNDSIVIREGRLFKGSGPEIYVVDNYELRQVSPEAMKVFFSRRKINTVEDSLLARFGQGPPVHHMRRCRAKPDIYVVEYGYKRRVTEPPTSAAKSWDKVNFVACNYLERLPDGPPIP